MKISPEDFGSDSPPARTIGTECEYNPQPRPGMPLSAGEMAGVKELTNAKITHSHNLLGSQYGGGKLYPDVGSTVEFCTREANGPADAAVQDIAGIQHLGSILDVVGVAHNGIFRLSGSYIQNGKAAGLTARSNSGATGGYHVSYLFPRLFADDSLVDRFLPTVLASSIWSMSGTVRESGYVLSQKAWGMGNQPVLRFLTNRTEHGKKPMIIIPPVKTDSDTIGDKQWARAEVRSTDPGLSLVNRFAEFAGFSLALRIVEQQHRFGKYERRKLGGLCLKNPTEAAQQYASDLSLTQTATNTADKQVTALDTQEAILDLLEPLNEQINLPADEELGLVVIRKIVDTLRQCNPLQAEYTNLARTRIEFVPRHQFVVAGRDKPYVTNADKNAVQRVLLWDRVHPKGNGLRYWEAVEQKDPLVAEINTLAAQAGIPPRAAKRAAIIDDPDNPNIVHNWSTYEGEDNKPHSLGSPIGD